MPNRHCYSVFRGQSERGEGEGPGVPVSYGEQFLAHTPGFPWDDTFPAKVRPWLKLTAPSRLHHDLKGKLTGWSLFTQGDYIIVSRISSVLKYSDFDDRPAYFAHGRAFRKEDLEPWMDPGIFLGDVASFDDPWPKGSIWPDLSVSPVSGDPKLEGGELLDLLGRVQQVVKEKRDTARHLLGHLFQARLEDHPLVILAQEHSFSTDSQLPRLLAFARAALPATLKKSCTLRIYDDDDPRYWLTKRKVSALVVEQSNASKALEAAKDAVLVDRHGLPIQKLAPVSEPVQQYADKVVDLVASNAGGLLSFSYRIGELIKQEGGAITPKLLASLRTVYSLAYTLHKPDAFGHLLQHFLVGKLKGRAALPWNRLMPPREEATNWERIPQKSLCDLALSEDMPLSAPEQPVAWSGPSGLRELGVTELASRIRENKAEPLDERIAGWWSDGHASLERLTHLLYLEESGVLRRETVASISCTVPTTELARSPETAVSVLRLEGQVPAANRPDEPTFSMLAYRGRDRDALASLVQNHPNPRELYSLLIKAGTRAILHPSWAVPVLEQMQEPGDFIGKILNGWATIQNQVRSRDLNKSDANKLPGPAGEPDWNTTWFRLLIKGLERLVDAPKVPNSLIGPLEEVAELSDPAGRRVQKAYILSHYLLVTRSPTRAKELVESFWARTENLLREELQELMEQALKILPEPHLLLAANGQFLVPKNNRQEVAPCLLRETDLYRNLPPTALLELYIRGRNVNPDPSRAIYQQLDSYLATSEEGGTRGQTIDALVYCGCYKQWRQGVEGSQPAWGGSRIKEQPLRASIARQWLSNGWWRNDGSRPVDLQTWRAVVEDLRPVPPRSAGEPILGGLNGEAVATLFSSSGEQCWPQVEDIEQEQFLDLCSCCTDLGTLVALFDGARASNYQYLNAEGVNPWKELLNSITVIPPEVKERIFPEHLAILSKFGWADGPGRAGYIDSITLVAAYGGERRRKVKELVKLNIGDFSQLQGLELARFGSALDLWLDYSIFRQRVVEFLGSLNSIPSELLQETWVLKGIDTALGKRVATSVNQGSRHKTRAASFEKLGFMNLSEIFTPFGSNKPGPETEPLPGQGATGSHQPVDAGTFSPTPPAQPAMDPLAQKVMSALTAGRSHDPVLHELLDQEKKYRHGKYNIQVSPLHQVAMAARDLLIRSGSKDETDQIKDKVWPTFFSFLRNNRGAIVLAGHTSGARLPNLELFLASTDSLPQVWLTYIVKLGGIEECLQEPQWWKAAYKTIMKPNRYNAARREVYGPALQHIANQKGGPFKDSRVLRAFQNGFRN